MAFSTQKDFFNVPFMNERYDSDCKRACVKLKSYESNVDNRSWAIDETKQSKFLGDLVTCQYPATSDNGEGDFVGRNREPTQTRRIKRSNTVLKAPKTPSNREHSDKNKAKEILDSHPIDDGKEEKLNHQPENLKAGDSLLECANYQLSEYQKLLNIKATVEKQLEVSNERLEAAIEENKAIKEILACKLDSFTAKDFYNKIQKFTAAGKFNKNEENEMLQIYQKMEKMNNAYEVLKAENNYLKRIIEKLTVRVALENITTEPEQSKDIGNLQKKVNSLRKECILLRRIEDDYLLLKEQQTNKSSKISEQDAENIKSIIKERNSLRQKCESLKSLQQQLKEFEHKTLEARKEVSDLSVSLTNKTDYINEIESEMQNMQKYYEEKSQNACYMEECLKAQLEEMKNEMIKLNCKAQKVEMLEMEVSCLRNEMLKRDLSLNEYDCQYKELMDVVNELQSVKLQSLHDNQTQTCEDQTDELTFYTCATLNEIKKELQERGCFGADYLRLPSPSGTKVEYDTQCSRELERLQQQVDEMKKEIQKAANNEDIYADAIKRLQELEAENAKLLQENQGLNGKLEKSEEKFLNVLKKVENLEKDINSNGEEANKIGKDLHGAIGLVKDISEVQLKNQQLANAVSAINSRDDQKIIDDLRRQLEEEMNKLKICQKDNAKLLEEAEVRELDLKELKEINNRLEAERSKILNENNNLKYQLNLLIKTEENPNIINLTDETRHKEASNKTLLEPDEMHNIQDVIETVELPKDISKNNLEEENIKESTKNESEDLKQQSRYQQKTVDLEEFITQSSKDAIKKEPSEIEIIKNYLEESQSFKDAIKKEPSEIEIIKNYLEEAEDMKQYSRTQQKTEDFNEFKTQLSKDVIKKEPTEIEQLSKEISKNSLEEAEDMKQNSLTKQKSVDMYDMKQYSLTKQKTVDMYDMKQHSLTKQKTLDTYEFKTQSSKDTIKKESSRSQQKTTDLDEFKKSPSKYVADKQQRRDGKQSKGRDADNKQFTHLQQQDNNDVTTKQRKDAALDDFVSKKSDTLKIHLKTGTNFEKELRKILEDFIVECSNCFCRLFNMKSKLYVICHKLCHRGIHTLSFRELAYLHKKIYAQADQLLPGCLLDIILSDNKEQVQKILKSMEVKHIVDNKKLDSKIPNSNKSYDKQKCCCCKDELCCDYSEEMLKDKVNQLEKDIGVAREYLEILKNIPLEFYEAADNSDSNDTNNSTYRASSPVVVQRKPRYTKHLKKLKAQMIKN